MCTLLGPEGPGRSPFRGWVDVNLWTFPGSAFERDAGRVPPVL